MGAAIFPETSKYGGGPEKMAMVAVRQRWRRCSGNVPREATRLGSCVGRRIVTNVAARAALT